MLAFRRARKAPASWNAVKTLGQIVVFWGFFLFFLPPRLVAATASLMPPLAVVPARWVTGLVFCGASVLGLWSAWTMVVRGRGTPLPLDTARDLVVSGPYRVVRNPMALAGVLQGVAVALWHRSWVTLTFFLGGAVLWHIMVRPIEEQDLLLRFGEDYARYRARTGLWWPRRTS
jgi:protein-S-isoprenylcysteine O-methyltransferase Ste14